MWSEIISRSKPRPSTVWAQRRNRPGVVPGPKFGTFTPNCTGQGYPATTRKERMPAWMWPLRQRVQRQVMVTRVPGRTRVPGAGPRTGDGPAYRGRARVPGAGPRTGDGPAYRGRARPWRPGKCISRVSACRLRWGRGLARGSRQHSDGPARAPHVLVTGGVGGQARQAADWSRLGTGPAQLARRRFRRAGRRAWDSRRRGRPGRGSGDERRGLAGRGGRLGGYGDVLAAA